MGGMRLPLLCSLPINKVQLNPSSRHIFYNKHMAWLACPSSYTISPFTGTVKEYLLAAQPGLWTEPGVQTLAQGSEVTCGQPLGP